MKHIKLITTCLILFFVVGCSNIREDSVSAKYNTKSASATASNFPEAFESGTKTSYAAANVTLTSGIWNFNDALIGNLSTDVKNGAQSARIRNTGKISMGFDLTNGAGTVSISHAKFGSDASSTWQLWYSINSGGSYIQTGVTITTASSTLQTTTFTLNISGTIRLEIRKISGGTNRINIDDFSVTDYGSGNPPPPTGKKFLFDATKAETAGNADWVIDEDNSSPQRTPTPAQSGITSSTPETYWTGAISAWGIALVKLGNTVETLPSGGRITYGDASNGQDLSNYNVFVVDEPNILFTASEKAAILNFVLNGGGLMMISDHTISDRNNDSYDSPEIWNDLMQNNSVQTNPFGFSIDLTNITETTGNVLSGSSNPILNGSQGNVTQLAFHNGATITLNPSVNSTVQGLIWRTSSTAQGNTNAMCASSTFGSGRVVIITDSSPADDGTAAPGNTVYNGWGEVDGNHARLHLNASLWLANF